MARSPQGIWTTLITGFLAATWVWTSNAQPVRAPPLLGTGPQPQPGTAASQPATAGNPVPRDYPIPHCWNTTQSYDIDFVGPLNFIVVGPVTVGYHRFGPLGGRATTTNRTKPPLVLLPGFATVMYIWPIPLLQRLAADREILMFDYPGVGASANSTSNSSSTRERTLTVAMLANSTMQLIRAMKYPQPPDVLGWSLGGMVAYTLAGFYGDEVGSLLVVSGSAGGPASFAPPPSQWDQFLKISRGGVVAENQFLFPGGFNDSGICSIYASWNSFFKSKYTKVERLTLRGEPMLIQQALAMRNFYINPRTFNALRDVSNRMLIIHGIQDRLVPIRNAAVAAAQAPGAWLIQVPGAGHGVLFQEPRRAIGVALEFFDSAQASRLPDQELQWYSYGFNMPADRQPATIAQAKKYVELQQGRGSPSNRSTPLLEADLGNMGELPPAGGRRNRTRIHRTRSNGTSSSTVPGGLGGSSGIPGVAVTVGGSSTAPGGSSGIPGVAVSVGGGSTTTGGSSGIPGVAVSVGGIRGGNSSAGGLTKHHQGPHKRVRDQVAPGQTAAVQVTAGPAQVAVGPFPVFGPMQQQQPKVAPGVQVQVPGTPMAPGSSSGMAG